ncbi:MAG: YqgE/AlgH family protein [Muribaculaceae bacterium]|nr:YqgE/AlgH family protein [Muribaculaceae bacterium]
MKTIDDIFNLRDEQPEPLAGSLLVARPTVGDPCFGRSVILVVEHGEQGTMGLILNRITNLTTARLLDEMVDTLLPVNGAIPIFLGGPVKTDELLFVHNLPVSEFPGGEAIGESGLSIGGDFEVLKRLLAERADLASHLRLCVGYSGWERGQLADELARHDWVVLDGCNGTELLNTPHDELWLRVVSRFGDRYRLWLNWPANPEMN